MARTPTGLRRKDMIGQEEVTKGKESDRYHRYGTASCSFKNTFLVYLKIPRYIYRKNIYKKKTVCADLVCNTERSVTIYSYHLRKFLLGNYKKVTEELHDNELKCH